MDSGNESAIGDVVIIGAGPAGLTAASELCKAGRRSVVFEKDAVVGGISRTVTYNGYLFDIGGHRFFTKVKAVEDMWHEYMQDDFLLRSRISRILYNRKFFNYPLKISNALSGLGLVNSVLVLFSYLKIRLVPIRNEKNFEDFVTNMFGSRLYRIFFKTYTEKVWGIPCTEISAEWAAQRIKGLSLVSAVKNALIGNRFTTKQTVIKTLIDSFHYPRKGPGMMWEKVTDVVNETGSKVHLESDVVKIYHQGDQVSAIDVQLKSGEIQKFTGSDFISTMPVRELIQKLDPPVPAAVLNAANLLNYRDFLTVALIVEQEHLFDDNWIYIHDQDVKVGRIQNFKNWSPEMVPDGNNTCLGLEYFCFEGDGLWSMDDKDLIELGSDEMEKLGFLKAADVIDGTVVRMPKAYPVYDEVYSDALLEIREFIESKLHNLQLVGRNGMHRYNNQDHSMLTAMLAVENIQGANNDLWQVNADEQYHEELTEKEAHSSEIGALNSTQPAVPERIVTEPGTDLINETQGISASTFGRIDKLSLGLAVGFVTAAYMFLFTILLVQFGAYEFGQKVELLGQYFYGYTFSYKGALVGLAYGFFWGFILGWLIAYLRNMLLGFYWRRAVADSRLHDGTRLLELI